MSGAARGDAIAAVGASILLDALARVPWPTALALGDAIGRGWARIGGPRTRDARINLRIAFPEWSEERRKAVLQQSLANLGRSLAEFAWLSRWSEPELRARVRIEGREHFDEALAAAPTKGAIILTAHFGSWEMLAAAMVAHGFPVSVVHRTRDNPALEELVAQRRRAGGAELLARGNAARAVLRGLRDGRLLAIPFDQNCPAEEGIFVPFFGRLACTRVAPARIAARTGAPVVPVFVHREPDGWRHVVQVRPAVEILQDLDAPDALEENVRRMTSVIEDEIRRAPQEWIWGHRRWRTQPAGEPRPYPRRRWRRRSRTGRSGGRDQST